MVSQCLSFASFKSIFVFLLECILWLFNGFIHQLVSFMFICALEVKVVSVILSEPLKCTHLNEVWSASCASAFPDNKLE